MRQRAKQLITTVAARGGDNQDEPEMMISTIDPDRDRDRVIPEGGDFKNFRRNSPLLYGHDYQTLPIGTVTRLDVQPGRGLRAAWRWLEGDPFADRVKNAWDQGVLRAASIGFLPLEWQPNELGGMDIERWELLELSLVPVPSNPAAVRALKQLGLLPRHQETESVLEVSDWPPMDSNTADRDVILELVDPDPVWDVDPSMLREACREFVRETILAVRREMARTIGQEVARAVNLARGRVD